MGGKFRCSVAITGFCNSDLSADKSQSYPPYDFSQGRSRLRRLPSDYSKKILTGSKEHKIKIITLAHDHRAETMWNRGNFNSAKEDLNCLINDHPNVVSKLLAYNFEPDLGERGEWLLSHLSEQYINTYSNIDSNNGYMYVTINDYYYMDFFEPVSYLDYDDSHKTHLNVIYAICFGTESACRSIGQRINCVCKNGTPVLSNYHGAPLYDSYCPQEGASMCASCDVDFILEGNECIYIDDGRVIQVSTAGLLHFSISD